ncbi:MAG: hypothetical protein JWR69_599 [Pedosphaera sp.]|nr:hypothetical protein [Pedosphaera sp.]
MTNKSIKPPSAARSSGWISPHSFLSVAVTLSVFFMLVHLVGFREHTAFLSGTTGAVGVGTRLSTFYGVIYILLYLGCVVIAPILVLAAGMLAFWQKFLSPDKHLP